MKLRIFLVVLGIASGGVFMLGSGPAAAEGRCPPGYFPIGGGGAGWEGCAPMGGDGDEDQGPQWQTRWGAIAVTDGAFGYSFAWSSEQKAIQEALRQCKNDAENSASAATCHVRLTYHDQCVALAWGANGNIVASAVNIATAERLAMDSCSKYSADCRIYYSGCSYPERVD